MPAYRLTPRNFDEAQYFLEVDLGLSRKVAYLPNRDNGQYTLEVCIKIPEEEFLKRLSERDTMRIWESFKPEMIK